MEMQPKFEARDREVWDITHPAECNHFRLLTVDTNGAMETWDEATEAEHIAGLLNRSWAEEYEGRS